jgi:hypothetical protein
MWLSKKEIKGKVRFVTFLRTGTKERVDFRIRISLLFCFHILGTMVFSASILILRCLRW